MCGHIYWYFLCVCAGSRMCRNHTHRLRACEVYAWPVETDRDTDVRSTRHDSRLGAAWYSNTNLCAILIPLAIFYDNVRLCVCICLALSVRFGAQKGLGAFSACTRRASAFDVWHTARENPPLNLWRVLSCARARVRIDATEPRFLFLLPCRRHAKVRVPNDAQ